MANNENRNQPQQQNKSAGNFANNPQKASEAGRKGGEHSHGSPQNANRNQDDKGGKNDQKR